MTLNFVTYDDQELDPVDIDNSEYMDLSDINKNLKHKREEQFKEYLLTNDIYEKSHKLLKAYCNLTDEDIAGLPDMSQADILTLITRRSFE